MPDSDFSVDGFEQMFMYELRDVYGQGMPCFTPLRVLGSTVSYDFGVYSNYWKMNIQGRDVDSHLLRTLMPVQRRAVLPNKYTSVFIGYRAPYKATTSRAKDPAVYEWWKEQGHRGYFRWDLDPEVDPAFASLQEALKSAKIPGLATYAAPAFSEMDEADQAAAAGGVLQRTHFQSPGEISDQEYYSYVGAGTHGRVYPDAINHDPAAFLSEIMTLQSRDEVEPFAAHLADIWKTVLKVLGRDKEVYDNTQDLKAARTILGGSADLTADPLSLLTEAQTDFPFFEKSAAGGLTLETFAAVVFAVSRIAREKFGCRWLVFYN